MFGVEHLGITFRIVAVVMPVSIYFLILGFLNSRRHPQLLSGRRDFVLMIAALSPLFVFPVLQYVRPSLVTVGAVFVALAGGIVLLAPRGSIWVIYNIPVSEARDAVARALRLLGCQVVPEKDGFHLGDTGALVRISGFPLLRNVSIRLDGGSQELRDRFGGELSRMLSQMPAETTPMAMGMLLIATAMMLAPLTLVAHRVPEIVRVLTDLLP
jgi:hypothetical protein